MVCLGLMGAEHGASSNEDFSSFVDKTSRSKIATAASLKTYSWISAFTMARSKR
jgi:hypothetical protein